MLDLFAKHLRVKLAEMTFIQFSPNAELGSVSWAGFHPPKDELQLL